jgi:hypothetical protein
MARRNACACTGQHKMERDTGIHGHINASSGIRTHDSSVRVAENRKSARLRTVHPLRCVCCNFLVGCNQLTLVSFISLWGSVLRHCMRHLFHICESGMRKNMEENCHIVRSLWYPDFSLKGLSETLEILRDGLRIRGFIESYEFIGCCVMHYCSFVRRNTGNQILNQNYF